MLSANSWLQHEVTRVTRCIKLFLSKVVLGSYPGVWCTGSSMSRWGILLQPSTKPVGMKQQCLSRDWCFWIPFSLLGDPVQGRGQIHRFSWPSHLNQTSALCFNVKHLYGEKTIIHGETYAQCCNSIKTSSLKALLSFAAAPHIIIWHML